VTPARARIVAVGSCGHQFERLAGLRRAVEDAAVAVSACVAVDDDDAALDAALAGDVDLVVIVEREGSPSAAVRRAVARACSGPLVLHEQMLALHGGGEGRGGSPRDERAALLPKGARLWEGRRGDAAWCVQADRRAFAVLPAGADLESIVPERLAPLAAGIATGRAAVVTRVLRVAGLPLGEVESRLARIADGDVTLTFEPLEGEVLVRLRARATTRDRAAALAGEAEASALASLGDDCYGRDDEALAQVAGRLLLEQALTVSVAESCTGGLVGHLITDVAGSSAYFERGVQVYSNRAKQEMLGVSEAVLREHGAVSAPCAEAMARGIAARSGTGCALSVTGIAGPSGATPGKPVGTVFIGVLVGDEVEARRFQFTGPRASIKRQSAHAALDLLRRRLLARRRETVAGAAP
jgi:nicotinamide-nucleotide amidase